MRQNGIVIHTRENYMKTKNMMIQFVICIMIMLLSACSSMTGPSISAATQADLVKEARMSLEILYATTPEAKELRDRSVAILVFPDIFKLGLIVGGSGGNGVLFSPGGHVLGYYNATSLSWGLQAGAQDYAEAMFLTKPSALNYLDSSDGWSIGVGPSITVIDQGMAKDLSTTTGRSDVYAFIYNQSGLMGGLGIQGQKITRLQQ